MKSKGEQGSPALSPSEGLWDPTAYADTALSTKALDGAKSDVVMLVLIWAASLFLVNPIGDFPLNDDWSYGLAVKRLIETGTFRPTEWTVVTLITQTVWGALFSLPAGFSFNALRVSTLVSSLCGMLLTYRAVRYVNPSRLMATTAALALGFNPIHYALSATFMTDVTFSALSMAAVVFFFRDIKTDSTLCFIIGTIFALAATLCRQLGLGLPLGFALFLLLMRGVNHRSLPRAIIPFALCVGTLLIFQHWLEATGRLSRYYFENTTGLFSTLLDPPNLLPSLATHIGIATLYLGWFLLPVIILALPKMLPAQKNSGLTLPAVGTGILFVLLCAIALPLSKLMMPMTGNILLEQGIGPLTLRGAYDVISSDVPTLGRSFWLAITVISVLGGATLLGGAVALAMRFWNSNGSFKDHLEQTPGALFLVCALTYLFPIFVLGGLDRYYIPALPLLMVGIAGLRPPVMERLPRLHVAVSLITLVLLMLFAVSGTRDYLAWNRGRWVLLNDLLGTGKATPEEVDGGFEFNGLYLFDADYKPSSGKSWWWVRGDKYLVAFVEKGGWKTVKKYEFSRWLPPSSDEILLLEKIESSGSPSLQSQKEP